jgi:hypothetical protein
MPRRAATTTAEGTTHLLRALLRPTLYRDIELESTDTLHTLAWGITQGCSTLWDAEKVEEVIDAADGGAEAVLRK